MANWNYGDKYKLYDMSGIIEIGGGLLKVHDIYEEVPEFMKQADAIFVDPPCSLGNLNTFYTKADKKDEYKLVYEPFMYRLFHYIDIIAPKYLFIEVFKSNKEMFIKECQKRYKYVYVDDSTYYHNKDRKCWILRCSNEENNIDPNNEIGKILDEEDYIKYICKNLDYKCIADPCMGRGLVGYHAYKNGKQFVGTELNKKRLAVLVDNITKEKRP